MDEKGLHLVKQDSPDTEEFTVSGEVVVTKIKELIREGNIRRIIIKNDDGRTLIEIPLTFGVVGTVLLPVWAALGAMAALVANFTIAVERRDSTPDTTADTTADTTRGSQSQTSATASEGEQ